MDRLTFKIIGEGERGFIIHPAFNGDTTMVSKLSSKFEIEKEVAIIKKLPPNDIYILPLYPECLPVTDIERNILINMDESFTNDELLTDYSHYHNIPYIKGVTLDNVEDVDEMIIVACEQFKYDLDKLHEQGWVHCAVFFQNVMYSSDNNRLYLIDFGTYRRSDEDNWLEAEKEDVFNMFEEMGIVS